MNNYNYIRMELDNINLEDLKKFCTKIGVKKESRKLEIIDSIMEIYNETFVEDNYLLLNKYEKALIDNYVQQKANPLRDTVESINQKYSKSNLTIGKYYYRYFIPIRYSKGYYMPGSIYNKLEDIVPERDIIFTETEPESIENFDGHVFDRANRIKDIDYIIKYVNANKVKPTSKNRLLSKKDINKIHNELGYDEILRTLDATNISEIKSIDDTSISYGLLQMLVAAKVIDNTKEYFKLGKECDNFIKLNKVDKVKYLLDKYLDADSVDINEIERIKTALIKTESKPFLKPARHYLIDMLEKLPIDKWIDGDEFKRNVRIDNYRFIRNHLNSCLVRDDYYNSYYNSPNFEQLEESFIDIFLIEYMSTLGIVDVITENIEVGDWCQRNTNITSYLRLTEFGAIVLGVLDTKDEEESDNGFVIDKEFNIMIPNGSKKMEYELFFERFLNKNSDDSYKLDFIGIAKALDLNISINEIIECIEKHGLDVDKVIINTLKAWLNDSTKIKVRNVMIIEYPEELSYLFSKNSISNNIEKTNNKHLIVKKDKVNNLKKEIEKECVYCDIK